MTKRKADMLRVAYALGLPVVAGETTGLLAERCASRAAELLELVSADALEGTASARSNGAEGKPSKAPRARKGRRSAQEHASP